MDHDRDDIPCQAPQEWLDALERADADIDAGRVVDGEAVHRELREAIARMQARQETIQPDEATQHR